MRLPRPFVWAPLRWTATGIVVGAAFVVLGYMDADLVNRRFEHAQQVQGVVDEQYDGESLTVPVTYVPPLPPPMSEGGMKGPDATRVGAEPRLLGMG